MNINIIRKPVQFTGIVCRQYVTDAALLPRIVVPHRWVISHENRKHRALTKKRKANKKINYKSQMVINCKQKEFNHYKGQSYSGFGVSRLASHGWKHKKSVGDYFTLEPYTQNPALQDTRDALHFEDLPLSKWIVHRLEEMGLVQPTVIQRKTIPKLLKGNNVLCAAETGSGKTLAYLLPLIDIIEKLNSRRTQKQIDMQQFNAPRAVIIVPTRELGAQIMHVAEMFMLESTVKAELLSDKGSTTKKIEYPKRTGMDIAISTPGVLNKLIAAGMISPSQCQHLVLDEVDTLLDDSFSSLVTNLMKRLGVHGGSPTGEEEHVNTGTQLAMVSATMPKDMDNILQNTISMESVKKITTDGLHQLMPHVSQKFIRVDRSQRADEILKIAYKNQKQRIPTMIFCNKSDTVFWLGKLLDDNDIPNMVLNSQMNLRRRYWKFENYQKELRDILVCTDIASRGLDTLRVQQVVNFDFPLYISDYIHRVGRVGRVGSETDGSVISFITRAWDVDLLWNIETSARKSRELQNVNANIKLNISNNVMRKYGANVSQQTSKQQYKNSSRIQEV